MYIFVFIHPFRWFKKKRDYGNKYNFFFYYFSTVMANYLRLDRKFYIKFEIMILCKKIISNDDNLQLSFCACVKEFSGSFCKDIFPLVEK